MTFQEIAKDWFEYHKIGLSYVYTCVLEDCIGHISDFIGNNDITTIKPIQIQKILLV